MEFISGVEEKIINKPVMEVKYNLCLWCDLLGFGKDLFQNQWNLNDELRTKIYNRLYTAHNEFLKKTSPITESNLILNDGLVKVSLIKLEDHPDIFGFFLRSCIETHLKIKEKDLESHFPGPRSIITYGESIKYFHSEVKFDDYVFNYSKRDPSKLSSLAKDTGNPTVVYNPEPFQMNMAFSKAFILDELGSKYRISGANLYLDNSVLQFMECIAKIHNIELVDNLINNIRSIYLKKGDDHAYFGFELVDENPIEYNSWKTITYRIISFFPPDEPISEFKYEIK